MADFYTQFSFMVTVDTAEQAEGLKRLLNAANEDSEENGESLYVDWSAEEGADGKIEFWFHDDEVGQVDWLSSIFEEWQTEFNIDTPISFEWSGTCNKPQLDAFGGGAVVIYKGQSHFMNTYDWIEAKKKELSIAE